MTRPALTIRARLTLLYTGVFAAGGVLLVAVTYALVAAQPTVGDTWSFRLPGGQISTSSVQGVGDQQEMEPRCRQALADRSADPQLRTKCVTAYQIWGARNQRASMLSHLLRYAVATLGAVLLLAALGGWIVAGRLLRRVHRITAAARAAAEHGLSTRVRLRGRRDEMRELAETFDDMLDQIQSTFDSQERFIANASHELRTPLSVMRTSVDVVLAKPAPTGDELRGMARDVRDAVDHAEELITALLTLARNERGLTVREEVDLATVAEDALDGVPLRDRKAHASLRPSVASGDPVLLERLVTNLLDNAVRHNLPGGHVWLETSTLDGRPTLTVANTGPVVAPDSVAGLFEPFHRQNDRSTEDGFGLGLAIVASIAAMHRASLTTLARPGGGLTVVLTMPAPGKPAVHERGADAGASHAGTACPGPA